MNVSLQCAKRITEARDMKAVCEALRDSLLSLHVCRAMSCIVFRANGDMIYPPAVARLEATTLKFLTSSQVNHVLSCAHENIPILQDNMIFHDNDELFFCRIRTLVHGEEFCVFFTKAESFDEYIFFSFLSIAHTSLERFSSQHALASILEYAAFVADQKEPELMLIALADMAREFSAADRATIWLADTDKHILWTKVAHGIAPIRIADDSGIVGAAFTQGQTIVCNDPYHDSRFNQEIDRKTGYTTNSIVALVIKNSDARVLGVLQCINKLSPERCFDDADIAKLNLVVSYIANTLELANLNKEIEDTQREVIFTMGEAGEFRSKETGNHVKRVAEYSYVLARGYGLSDADAELLKMASPMHDIGKVAIEDAILKKPGKLTAEEFEIMKTHTVMGYDILKHSKRKIISAAATVAHEHHERFDGNGYPRKLCGEDIHIFGRITAVADVFDALASARCYKPAWELSKICDLFREERGKQFDPKLVDVFFEHLDTLLAIQNNYKDL